MSTYDFELTIYCKIILNLSMQNTIFFLHATAKTYGSFKIKLSD